MICALHEVVAEVDGGESAEAVVIVEGYSLCRSCAAYVVRDKIKSGRAMRGILNQTANGRFDPETGTASTL